MIVNYTEQGWEIVTQRAHGLLAAQLAMHLQLKQRPTRWAETVIAIAGHDDAQTELADHDLLTPQGGPVNFAMKLFEIEHCTRLLDFSLSRSRYTALLASMHIDFLYQKEITTNPEVKAFLAEQHQLQTKWRKELKLTKAEASRIYGIMEWCDAFSLLLCQHEVQPEQRAIEISRGAGDPTSYLKKAEDGSLQVSPWPFEDSNFEIHIETRIIPQLQFDSTEEFKKAFLDAEVKEKSWILKK